MIETHDLFLRALAIPKTKNRDKKKKAKDGGEGQKWPEHVLVIDTESRLGVGQSLTFGVWKRCKLAGDKYVVIEEGVFHADDLLVKDLKVLWSHMETAVSDVPSFPPRFPVYSRSQFMKKVFWPALKRDGAMVVGFNLGFDLTRLALDWKEGNKGEWSLIMMRYADGKENCNYPRILITPIDSKKQIIKLWLPWKKNRHEWKDAGRFIHFLDLRTLLWALYNKSYSLGTACDNMRGPFKGQNLPQKDEHEPSGEVTPDEIEYCRQDVRCTVGLLNACKQEFDKHVDLNLGPWNAYSPASIAKACLKAMGIERPEVKFKLSNKRLGPWMQAYYGGRSECRVRHEVVPVAPVDFTSEYPSCCANLGLFKFLTAKRLNIVDDTENVKRSLANITLESCFRRETWCDFNFVARIMPEGDILPVRTVYEGVTHNIGNNYLHPNPIHPEPVYMAGPDLLAAVIQQPGKIPHILQAFRIVPSGKQPGMRAIRLRGEVLIDPNDDSVDLFTKIIEERKRNKEDDDLYHWLKILANSIYGFFVELIPEHFKQPKSVTVFSGDESFPDSSRVIERRGKWLAPYLATLITSAGRLLLAMLEVEVKRANGTYLYCDTDSLAIIASEQGGTLHIPGAQDNRILTHDVVDRMVAKFRVLSPYDAEVVQDLLNLTDDNFTCQCSHELKSDHDSSGACEVRGCHCKATQKVRRQLWGVGVAAKRYTLFEKLFDKEGNLTGNMIVNPKAHGIGFLYPPKDNPKNWKRGGVTKGCGIATGDFNGDGILDLVITGNCGWLQQGDGPRSSLGNGGPLVTSDNISVLLGKGDGTFQDPKICTGVSGADFPVVGDFNSDGKADVAVIKLDNTVTVLLGKGDGTFLVGNTYTVGQSPQQIVTGDFNGDGKLDLATVNADDGTISVLPGNGDGSFRPAINNLVVDGVNGTVFGGMGLAVGDFNGDGRLDAAVTTGSLILILLGDGAGGLHSISHYYWSAHLTSVVVADFNGDGIPDVAGTDFGAIEILAGLGNGSFDLITPSFPNFINADPSCAGQPFDSFFGHDCTGWDTMGFGPNTNPPNSNPYWLAIGDFNGDGKPDIASANLFPLDGPTFGLPSSVAIFLNTTPFLNTATGSNIGVHPLDTTTNTNPVTLTFSGVTQPGMTTLTTSSTGTTPPAGFQLGTPAIYYNLHSTATLSGAVTVCINYAGASFSNPLAPRLFHFESSAWVDITTSVDTAHTTICGSTSSFSPFIVAQPAYAGVIQDPINADGTSVFNATKGAVPVKFSLTLGNVSTCALPAASIALTRTSGSTPGAIDESVYDMPSDTGTSFRISGCQYIYNLAAKSLGPGAYRADIVIGNHSVGSGFFGLRDC